MRPWLRWTLLVTVLLAVAALCWPERPDGSVVVAAAQRERSGPAPVAVPISDTVAGPDSGEEPASLDAPDFDPFAGVQAPPPPPTPVPASKPLVGPLYEAPPPPPAMPYRYLGRLVDPAGKPLIFLAKADKDLQVGVGTRLDEGYVVESITGDGVHLLYAPLGLKVLIPIPLGQDASTP